jgi:lysozyme
MKKKVSPKRRPRKKAGGKKQFLSSEAKKFVLIFASLLLFFAMIYHYREALAYYFSFKSRKASKDKELFDVRNYQVLSERGDKSIGFDVSQYQGNILWEEADSIEKTFPLDFVFIRSTAGKNHVDTRFKKNWKSAGDTKLIRGAYHYYRPDESSIEQALLFIKTVKLRPGDLPPVLDIEQLPKHQPIDSLRRGLKRWLVAVENHYGVRPILYTGQKFYEDFLIEEFSEYEVWIANYNFFVETMEDDWLCWQFTERGSVPGIVGNVDLNLFGGTREDLVRLTIGMN